MDDEAIRKEVYEQAVRDIRDGASDEYQVLETLTLILVELRMLRRGTESS